MSKNKNHIDQLTPELIDRYYKGLLSEDEQYQVEKLMLNSSFDNEAMEGFDEYEGDLLNDLQVINTQLEERVEKEKNDNIFVYIKIAASVLLLALSTYLVWDIASDTQKNTTIAQNESTQSTEQIREEESLPEKEIAETPIATENESSISEQKTAELEDKTPSKNKTERNEIIADNNLALDIGASEEIEDDDAGLSIADEEIIPETAFAKVEEKTVNESFQLKPTIDTSSINALTGKVVGVNIENSHNPPIKANELEPVSRQGSTPVMESRKKVIARSTTPSSEVIAKEIFNKRTGPRSVTGKVTSIEDGQPLPGVNVILKGTTQGAVTDIDGNFKITDVEPAEENALVISFIGLATEEVEIGDKSQIDIQMGSDVSQLSEVVVVGYGAESSDVDNSFNTWDNSRPSVPMSEYKDYLKENIRYGNDSVKGKVIVKFDILENGMRTNFEIKRSLNDYYDQEAIRLIKEGPEWLPAEQNGNKVISTVRVTVRFDKQ